MQGPSWITIPTNEVNQALLGSGGLGQRAPSLLGISNRFAACRVVDYSNLQLNRERLTGSALMYLPDDIKLQDVHVLHCCVHVTPDYSLDLMLAWRFNDNDIIIIIIIIKYSWLHMTLTQCLRWVIGSRSSDNDLDGFECWWRSLA